MKKRVAVFIGTRPEGIKMAPVIKALQETPDLHPLVISTGQHREMLAQVVDIFDFQVDYDLDVMQPDQTLAGLSSRLMVRIDKILAKVKPDFSLVQGDTTTVLIASLACYYRHIPVGHVEAGLRTRNMYSPFPEEANRRLAAPLMSLHFPPTMLSRKNLIDEGIEQDSIEVTGNTIIDALFMEVERQSTPYVAAADIDTQIKKHLPEDWKEIPYVLITGHRRENFGHGFRQICKSMEQLAGRYPSFRFIYPVHMNPNVQKPVYEQLGGIDNIFLIPPQDYSVFIALMSNSYLILTDSGGVQEEAPSLGKPVLVMRENTERPEGVEAGTAKLIGVVAEDIVANVSELIDDRNLYELMSNASSPYGDGLASHRIVEAVLRFFQ